MSVEVSFGLSGAVLLGHSFSFDPHPAAPGDLVYVELNVKTDERDQVQERDLMNAADKPLIPMVVVDGEVLFDLEAPDCMTIGISLDLPGLDSLVDYLSAIRQDWRASATADRGGCTCELVRVGAAREFRTLDPECPLHGTAAEVRQSGSAR